MLVLLCSRTRFLTFSSDVTRIQRYCYDCTSDRHSVVMLYHSPNYSYSYKYEVSIIKYSANVYFISLPILIECVETCIHVKSLRRIVLIKPISSGRHIVTATILFHHLRSCMAPTHAGRYPVYLSEPPDQYTSAANSKKITTLLKMCS